MGFFSTKAICAVCGKEIGLNRFQLANKEWICPTCFKACGYKMTTPIKTITSEQAKSQISLLAQNKNTLSEFSPTKIIRNVMEVDENQQLIIFHTGFFGGRGNSIVYKYEDILGYELLEDGETVTKGGLGRAVVGGLLFGGLGAIVGGVTGGKRGKSICNSLKIKITINSMNSPAVFVSLISSPTKKDSFVYKTFYKLAQEALSLLQIICKSVEDEKIITSTIVDNTGFSAADEILKFKNLLDKGIISQEEFDDKKRQLLGIQ